MDLTNLMAPGVYFKEMDLSQYIKDLNTDTPGPRGFIPNSFSLQNNVVLVSRHHSKVLPELLETLTNLQNTLIANGIVPLNLSQRAD